MEWYDLAGAEQALTRALRIAENSSYLSAVVNAYGGLAALRCSQGNFTQAIELIEKGMQSHSQARINPLSRSLPGAESGILGASRKPGRRQAVG